MPFDDADWAPAADIAKPEAQAAQTTADTATTKADAAQSTADTAKSNAATAQTAANTAQSTATAAKTVAANAQSTANAKSRTFTAQPTVPYAVGDIYKNGTTVSICTTARATGSYTASDWVLTADKTSDNTAADTAKVGGTSAATVLTNITAAKNAASTADGKAVAAQTTATDAQTRVAKQEALIRESAGGVDVGKSADGKTYADGTSVTRQGTDGTFSILKALAGALTTVASFGESVIELGKNSTSSVIRMCGGKVSVSAVPDAKGRYTGVLSGDYGAMMRSTTGTASLGVDGFQDLISMVAGYLLVDDGTDALTQVPMSALWALLVGMDTRIVAGDSPLALAADLSSILSALGGSSARQTSGVWSWIRLGTTVVLWGRKSFVVSWNSWGSMYETNAMSLGSFPITFSSPPVATLWFNGGFSGFIEGGGSVGTDHLGECWVCRPVPTSATNVELMAIVIGSVA